MTFRDLVRQNFLDIIKSVDTPSGMKVLVLDELTTNVVSSFCTMPEVMDQGVSIVLPISLWPREPLPTIEAIYFVSPTEENVEFINRDFANKNQYHKLHLFFTTRIEDSLMNKFTAKAVAKIVALKEINLEFFAPEQQVYHLGMPEHFKTLFFPEAGGLQKCYATIASRLVTLCASLGEYPLVRYSQVDTTAAVIAEEVQARIDKLAEVNPDYPPKSNGRPRATLFILDRKTDIIAPVIHEFTYQAAVNDLLKLENEKYTYSITDQTNTSKEVTAFLNETDPIWNQLRHKHLTECADFLNTSLNELIKQRKDATQKHKDKKDFKAMSEQLKSLPQYQALKDKYSLHLDIAGKCFDAIREQQLKTVGQLEQDIACGIDEEGKEINKKTLLKALTPVLENQELPEENKLRLLIAYLQFDSSIKPGDKRELIGHANLSESSKEVIENLKHMTPLSVSAPSEKKEKKKKKAEEDEATFALSRFKPALYSISRAHIEGKLPEQDFPYKKPPPPGEGPSKTGRKASKSLKSVNTIKKSAPGTWFKKKKELQQPTFKGERLILFVAGGVSYAEVRSAYELSQKFNMQIIIGGTSLMSPQQYLSGLGSLKEE